MVDLTDKLNAATRGDTAQREPFFMGGVRTAMQGPTFGFGDEIEAGVRSVMQGVPYDQAVAEARGSQQRYQEQNPWKAMGLQIAASLPLALTGIGAGAGLRGMMGLGALSGGVTQIGSNEGNLMDRTLNMNVPVAAGIGALAGPAMKAASGAIGNVFVKAVDYARRTLGNRGSVVFENYLADLVSRTGKTADELVDDIGNGRMLIDNETVTAIARGSLVQDAQAGASRAILQGAMEGRPEDLRRVAGSRLLSDLTRRSGGESAADIQRQLIRGAEDYKTRAYAPFKNEVLDPAVEQQLLREIGGSPSIMNELEDAYKVQTRGRSLFVRDEDGNITGFDRALTADDLERVRRAAANMATREYDASRGLVGEAASGLETDLRNTVDTLYPDMARVRANTSRLFQAGLANKPDPRNAFALGQRSVLNADEAALNWNNIVGDPLLEDAFRRGLMDNLSRRLASGTSNTTLKNLASEESAFGQVLRMVYPADKLDDALAAMKLAVDAQNTRNTLLGGSQTGGNISESARSNSGIDPMDAFEAATGSLPALYRTINNIIGKTDQSLSTADRERLARLLIETNPDVVRAALVDDGKLRTLQNAITMYIQNVSGAAGIGAGNAATIMVPNEPLRVTIDQPSNSQGQ